MLIEDEEMLAEYNEDFITKASTLLMSWKQDRAAKLKQEEQQRIEEEKEKKEKRAQEAETDSQRAAKEKEEQDKAKLANSKKGQLKQDFVNR